MYAVNNACSNKDSGFSTCWEKNTIPDTFSRRIMGASLPPQAFIGARVVETGVNSSYRQYYLKMLLKLSKILVILSLAPHLAPPHLAPPCCSIATTPPYKVPLKDGLNAEDKFYCTFTVS